VYAVDGSGNQFYLVFVNDNLNIDPGTSRSAVVQGLTPETSYVITVKARDLYGNNVPVPLRATLTTQSRRHRPAT